MTDKTKPRRIISSNFQVARVIASVAFMVFALCIMLFAKPERFESGRVDFSMADLNQNKMVAFR